MNKVKTDGFMFQETCDLCRGTGLYVISKCVLSVSVKLVVRDSKLLASSFPALQSSLLAG